LCTNRILKDVVCNPDKRFVRSFFRIENVVIRLFLPLRRQKRRTEVFAKELGCAPLIRVRTAPEPDQVHVIRHQHVGRTKQTIAGACVEKGKLPAVME